MLLRVPFTTISAAGERVQAMKRFVLPVTSAVCLATLLAFLLSSSSTGATGKGKGKGPEPEGSEPTPTAYNPYPAGILPADVDSEVMRVQHEIQGIEDATLIQAKALPTPSFTTNPP